MSQKFPFEFVLDELQEIQPFVKQMFGTHTIYSGEKVYLAARKREKYPEDNGLWIATNVGFHESLMTQFPSITYLHSIKMKKWLYNTNYA